jgi:hypothetical protein
MKEADEEEFVAAIQNAAGGAAPPLRSLGRG